MLTVGLIGCGGMGGCHAQSYAELKGVAKVVAVADLCPEKADALASLLDAKAYTSADELLKNEKPDIIDVCLPTYMHAEYAIKAMELGCNVLVEKPVCLNSDECKAMLEAQKRTGVKVQVAHVIRFWNEYVWLKGAIDSGEYGQVSSAAFRRLSPNPSWGWENWFNNYKLSGTCALDLHIHDADFVRYAFGDTDKVSAYAARDKDGVIQGITAVYEYESSLVTVEGQWDYPSAFPFCMEFRVNFEKALAVYEKGELTVYPQDGEPFKPEFDKAISENVDTGINISNNNGYYNEILHFIECVENGKDSEIAPLIEGVKTISLVEKEIKLAGGAKI